MPTLGRGSTDYEQSFITIGQDATLKGVSIFYPDQPCLNQIPAVYPPSIYMNGSNAACQDVELLNSYIGIWAVQVNHNCFAQELEIINIRISPF